MKLLWLVIVGISSLGFTVGCRQPYFGAYEASNEFPEKGMVPNEAVAVELGFAMLKSIYGQKEMEQQLPFKGRIDRGVWVVEGHFPTNPPMVGGSAFIGIRRKDGKVMFWGHTV